MKNVQRTTFKMINRIISGMLVILGFSGCSFEPEDDIGPLMYGTISATYAIKGKVINAEDKEPLPDLQVEATITFGSENWRDTILTNQQGEFKWEKIPEDVSVRLITSVPDVAPEEAAFLPDTTFVSIKDVLSPGEHEGWDKEKGEVNPIIEMKKNTN